MQVNSIQSQNFGALKWTGDNIFKMSEKAGLSEVKSQAIKAICDKLPFPKGTEVWLLKPTEQKIGKVTRKRGAVIAITGQDVCKGVILDPVTCNDRMLAYKYAIAMKKLAKADFSAANNAKEKLQWVG